MDQIRFDKAQKIRAAGGQPYAAKFDRTHTLADAKKEKDGSQVIVAGRVMLMRDMGKMLFATLQDHTGRLQIAMRTDEIGQEAYDEFISLVDLGDIIGIEGERFATQKGEPTVRINKWTMLTKALRQPPEKWHGVQDQETAWRQRY